MHLIRSLGPYLAVLAVVTWWEIRHERSKRTDTHVIPQMYGDVPPDGTALTEWEEERLEWIKAGLAGQEPAGQRWFPWENGGRP